LRAYLFFSIFLGIPSHDNGDKNQLCSAEMGTGDYRARQVSAPDYGHCENFRQSGNILITQKGCINPKRPATILKNLKPP
jgi:hypothetical protein